MFTQRVEEYPALGSEFDDDAVVAPTKEFVWSVLIGFVAFCGLCLYLLYHYL